MAMAAIESGTRRLRARQKPEKRTGKRTRSAHVCDKLWQCPPIVDGWTSVCCPVSCKVVYPTNLLIGKTNATKAVGSPSEFCADHLRDLPRLELRRSPPSLRRLGKLIGNKPSDF